MNGASSDEPQPHGCPPLAVLEESVASGALSDDLREHLSRCDHCSQAHERIRADNELIEEFVRANGDLLADTTQDRRFTGYEILGEIQRGGQGVVYKAVHAATRRPVALKMLLHGSFATSRQRRRFEREAEIAAGLRHPNIVTVYDSGRTDDGHHYLAMEYVDGAPLDEHVRSLDVTTSAGVRRALRIFAAICEGVAAAHARGVIHRDLKPANILVGADGQPRVLDFGLARQMLSEQPGMAPTRTIEGEFRGTFTYAAPEQVAGDPDEIDIRADVYALGVILYEMLTGRHPHGRPSGVAELITAIRESDPADPRSPNPAIDDEVRTIILTAMAKDPSRRYQSATALLDDVGHYLAGEPINAKRDSRWYLLRKTVAHYKAAAVASAAAVVLLAAFGVVMSVLYQRALAAEHEAEMARDLERAQRLVLEQREGELSEVVNFQAHMFSMGLNPSHMGVMLRRDILGRAQAAIARGGESSDPLPSFEEVERLLAAVNFTDVALESLYENIFHSGLVAAREQFSDQPLVRARLIQTIASSMMTHGMLERALAPQDEALAIRRDVLGEEDRWTLNSLKAKGDLLSRLDRLAEAEECYLTVLDGRRRLLGPDDPSTLEALNAMGALLVRKGDFERGEEYLRESLDGLRRRGAGEESVRVLERLQHLGIALWSQGRFAEAQAIFIDVLDGYRQAGVEDNRLYDTLHNLGAAYFTMGDYAEAEARFRETLQWRRLAYGDLHIKTLNAINDLGQALSNIDELDEAAILFEEALEGYRRVLSPDHRDTLRLLNSIAVLYRKMGNLEKAESYYRETLDACRRVFASDHPNTLTVLHNLGELLRYRGDYEAALAFLNEALEGRRSRLHPDNPQTMGTLGSIIEALGQQGRWHEAEPYARDLLERSRRILGGDNHETVTNIGNLGALLREMEVLDEAVALGAEAVERSRRVLADQPWHIAVWLDNYGRSLAALERFNEAETAMLEAHALFTTTGEEGKPWIPGAVGNLINLYDAWHASDPEAGHNEKAAHWRAMLP